MKIAGYCALCRAQEIHDYGVVLNDANARHRKACKKAGCKHPADYEVGRGGKNERRDRGKT